MVFDTLSVAVGGIFIHSNHLEKLGKNTMSIVDVLCNGHPRFCEAYAAVFLVVYVAALVQPLKHLSYAGRANVEIVRDVNCRSITLAGYQLINDFKVVLHPACPANLLSIVGITDGLEAVSADCAGLDLEFPWQLLQYLRDLYNNKYYDTIKKSYIV
jgi:hypothetical protein